MTAPCRTCGDTGRYRSRVENASRSDFVDIWEVCFCPAGLVPRGSFEARMIREHAAAQAAAIRAGVEAGGA